MKKLNSYIAIATFLAGMFVFAGCSKDQSSGSFQNDSSAGSTGTGGSLARFTIASGSLYVVDHSNLHTFSLSNTAQPTKVNTVNVGFNIETIFSYKDKLFIGSQDAMYVYSIANPERPKLIGSATHVRACDPVVANDSTAYVTVRSGNNCGGNINALMVYKINNGNFVNPTFVTQVNLTSPHGLGIQDNTLFVCDPAQGLVVFDISNNQNPVRLSTITGAEFYDVIPFGDQLYCMIKGGTAIYDISDRNSIKLLAKITQ